MVNAGIKEVEQRDPDVSFQEFTIQSVSDTSLSPSIRAKRKASHRENSMNYRLYA